MNCSGTPTPVRRRALWRTATVLGAALGGVLLLAAPAAAHTEIELDNPTAGATNVTMSVSAEAESDKAGIASVAVQLPSGLTPSQVSLVSAPAGWTLAPTADGYQVSGAALKTGVDARYQIKIAKLPDTPGVLTFKTVVTYANGDTDSWIGAPDATNPAPTVTLKPGAASSASPTPSAVTSSAPSFSNPRAAIPVEKDSGWPAWATWLLIGGAVVLAAGVTALVLRSRRQGGTGPSA